MQKTTSTLGIALIVLVCFASVSLPAQAQFTAGIERHDCGDLKREIKRNWMQLQPFYEPKAKNNKKPKSSDLYCVAPGYKNQAFSKASASRDYKCYTLKEINFCCDRQHKACVALK